MRPFCPPADLRRRRSFARPAGFAAAYACLAAVLAFTLCGGRAAAQESPVTLGDVIAGIERSESLLRDYQLEFKTEKRWHYDIGVSHTRDEGGNVVDTQIRYEPKSDEDKRKCIRREYTWRAKGALFAFETSEQDEINDRSSDEKLAFDGHRLLVFQNDGGRLNGSAMRQDGGYVEIPGDIVKPEAFFREADHVPVTHWLSEHRLADRITMSESTEEVSGRQCYVIEAVNFTHGQKAKFWICPETGFRPLKVQHSLGQGYAVYTITEIEEVADGIWFPIRGTVENHLFDPQAKSEILYSQVDFEVEPGSLAVNTGISDDAFTFRFPNGTWVHDRITGQSYTVGEAPEVEDLLDDIIELTEEPREGSSVEGGPAGPEETSGKTPGAGAQGPQPEPVVEPPPAVAEDDGGSSIWLAVAVALAAVIAGLVFLRRRGGRSA